MLKVLHGAAIIASQQCMVAFFKIGGVGRFSFLQTQVSLRGILSLHSRGSVCAAEGFSTGAIATSALMASLD